MIGDFGVLPTGLAVKRVDDILTQMQQSLEADLGANFSLLSQTPEGQLVNRMSEQAGDLWEFGEQVYNAMYPDTASGVSLDNARAQTNNFRRPATATVVNQVNLTGTPGAVIPAGTQFSVPGSPASVFQLVSSATLDGFGSSDSTSALVCLQTGPVPVQDLASLPGWVIVTPVTGLTAATSHVEFVELGTLVESDAAFRIRSSQELNQPGTGTYSGLKQAVENVLNVSQVYLFINDTDSVDANSLLPHSVELVVVGGVTADIANAIMAAKGAGIQTNGAVSTVVYDSQGVAHTILFNRLTQTPIWMTVSLTVNSNPALGPVYPGNGDALVAAAILSYGASYLPGQTVVTTGFFTPINSVPGVLGATILIGLSDPPLSSDNISIPIAQVAQFLSANLVVAHS